MEDLLEYPELRDAEIERIKAETELHVLEAKTEALKHLEMERGEIEQKARMRHYGEFMFYNPIVEASVGQAMLDLFALTKKLPEGHPITISFNSPGGYVTDGFSLYDFIRDLSNKGNPITTKCIGIAASMGAILVQAGDERVMTPNAFLMIHEVSGQNEGSTSEREDQLKVSKAFQARALDILASRSNMSKSEITKRWQRKDWYMSAEEALKAGFIDRIEGQAKPRRRRKAS